MDESSKEGKGRHDLLLQEIEAIDDYWGPTFRAIFDTDECDAFAEKLESRIRSHDKDIEKLCSAHHQGFIESIRDLLELKGLANRIHGEVQTIDSEICQSISQLKLKGQELAEARRIERNMKTTIEMLQSCLPVLRAYIKLQQQMKEKRYYPALKTLEQLEHIHLPSISHYRFSEHMKKSLAKVRESIKEASMSDLKDFLESIRKYSPKIGEVAMRHSYCTDPALMLKIKNLVMLFSSTLKTYGYSVSQLVELLQEIRDHYNEVLMQRWVHVFRDIFDEDNYHPMQVPTAAEYQRVMESFPYRDSSLEASPFPKRFPFSSMVPRVYRQIQNYIQACLQFSQDLNLADQEIDDTLRRYTNLLLTRTLSGCLSTLIRKPSLSLLQLIQISINTNYLEESNGWLEEFIAQLTGASRELSHIARLQGRAVFRDVRDDAEQQIYEALKRKMDEFMELANYDWLLNEPSGQASSYLMDLIAFLQSTFQAFTNLKEHVAQNACLTACRHIAEILMDLLLSDDVKSVSMGALQQVNLDVIQCEQFAASEPVPGFEDGTLLSSFLDLRQLLDLLLSWDWSAYFHDYGQETSKYLRVSPQRAITVLEKLREADKRTVFSVLKKSERDKKKLMETVLRQLRQLLQSSA
uniref:Exocyst complex component n=1 Tax=Simocephalus serrulatus TaxID=117539 RepID=A0A4Y7NNB0_9CRUS|nr:EOG090X01NK [Simocephalus serrulatus]SVE94087.1 EOG090X01NK [Simocephalus serrulatus]